MAQKKSLIDSTSEYTRIYENMQGVNFSEQASDATRRFAHIENMYVDYEGGGTLESIPGFRRIAHLKFKVHGIFSQTHGGEEFLLVHSGKNLYRFNIKDRDNLENIIPIFSELADNKSSAVSYGDLIYILDGENIVAVDRDGNVLRCGDSGAEPYIPTTHINNEAYEPRNLLTPKFKQKILLKQADEYSFGTPGIEYAITDYDDRLCAVYSISDEVNGEVYIPSFATIGSLRFKVTAISDSAFALNTKITSVITGANLQVIGNAAFSQCTSLERVILSRTVKSIGSDAFSGCNKLNYFYVGESFEKFGSGAFDDCTSLKRIHYAKGRDEFALIKNTAVFEDRAIEYNVVYNDIRMGIPLEGTVESISSLTINGTPYEFSFTPYDNQVVFDHHYRPLVEGRELEICGRFATEESIMESSDSSLTPEECIFGCRLSAVFDGRIFLSGNPKLPGIVFYSGNLPTSGAHPFYFGEGGYIADGAGGSEVTSLLSRGDGLFIFKRGDDGEGNIFFHTADGEGSLRNYPVSYMHKSGGSIGAAISFMGDPIFVSSLGVCTPKRDVAKDFIGIACRSPNISKPLSAEPLSDIRLEVWRGYLVLSSGGRIYLGDSRARYSTGDDFSYEWYYLNGIGSYTNDSRVYRYASKSKEGYSISNTPDERVNSTVYSVGNENGTLDYFVKDGENKIAVYPTEEREGGIFSPAVEIKCLDELFFFGTSSGDLCIFNNDKRGAAPPTMYQDENFSAEEYNKSMGRSIHPYYYSFTDHAIPYIIATAKDDCELPYLEKNTVRASGVLKLKCPSGCDISVSVKTDNVTRTVDKIRFSRADFSNIDFSCLGLGCSDYSTVAISDCEKRWIEKQYVLTSTGFRMPIGICSLAYRYKIKGKIKNR